MLIDTVYNFVKYLDFSCVLLVWWIDYNSWILKEKLEEYLVGGKKARFYLHPHTNIPKIPIHMQERIPSPRENEGPLHGIYGLELTSRFVLYLILYLKISCFMYFRCDRILWRGDGIEQLSYVRGESRFSDHRPVCAFFAVEVEVMNKNPKFRKGYSCAATKFELEECLSQRQNFCDF